MNLLRFVTYVFMSLFLCFSSFAKETLSRSVNACAYHIAKHERLKSIPKHLLSAISKVESGRLNPESKKLEAWPWTINVQGQGKFFSTKTEAVQEVKKLLRQGIRSIDVGCMQVNLYHHKDAFANIEEAFEPKHNVDYAASFLSSLRDNHGSWSKAVAHYHSASPQYHIPYRQKVLDVWRKTNRNPDVQYQDSPYLRGALWAKDVSADYPTRIRKNHKNQQWDRYETRMAIAKLRAKALQSHGNKAKMQTASYHPFLRQEMVRANRLDYLRSSIATQKNLVNRKSKKKVLLAKKEK